ncbi:SDR family NAD(P)-dependent oxidoreductase [Amycolatopsis sp. NPDC051372]|uniref:SDR family NAD(P)-dependent oxidoreductase n=1 Tax=unclassified Amycolatopsis TaxID=2618356 RepID=UPI003448DBE9
MTTPSEVRCCHDNTDCLVTGAGKGIGKAIAAGLAARGFDVWLGLPRPVPRHRGLRAEVGGRFVRLDAASDEEVAAAVRTIGCLDVLVNNTGANTGCRPRRTSPRCARSTRPTCSASSA